MEVSGSPGVAMLESPVSAVTRWYEGENGRLEETRFCVCEREREAGGR